MSAVQEKVLILFKPEFYISRLHLGKGVWTGFHKCCIFHLNLILGKWSSGFTTNLVFHIKSTSLQPYLPKKETHYGYFS